MKQKEQKSGLDSAENREYTIQGKTYTTKKAERPLSCEGCTFWQNIEGRDVCSLTAGGRGYTEEIKACWKGDFIYIPAEGGEELFHIITERMNELYKRKNKDYNNAFSDSVREFGLVSPAIRMTDKINRFKSLISKEGEVKDESLTDTLIDLACYAVMAAMEVEKRKKED